MTTLEELQNKGAPLVRAHDFHPNAIAELAAAQVACISALFVLLAAVGDSASLGPPPHFLVRVTGDPDSLEAVSANIAIDGAVVDKRGALECVNGFAPSMLRSRRTSS